jgi:formylmethanofuran--tetrahydromethanopterin N-formyltransferase
MRINGVEIDDTFAEAFGMWASRLIVTADTPAWARTAAAAATGFATSIIGCGCEAGINELGAEDGTPDGRPGVALLFFTVSRDKMEEQLLRRVGQAVMTTATSACYNGLDAADKLKVGGKLRYFGDGFQRSKLLDGRRLWRVPVMDGEFIVEESFGVAKAVGGGNFFVVADDLEHALAAAESAVAAMRAVPGVIMPFPGGIVRSGSKTSARYKGQHVSSNTPYCPTLRASVTRSALEEGENAVLEIVVDGLDEASVGEAMRVGVRAACTDGVRRISAGNFGGSLGQFQFGLQRLVGS